MSLKSSKSAINRSQFFRFLKQVPVNLEGHSLKFLSSRIQEKIWAVFWMNFRVILFLPRTWCKSRLQTFSCHHSIDVEDSFTIFQLHVANIVQFSVLSRTFFRRQFFFLYGFSRVGQFLMCQLKRILNFKGTVTKDINIVKCSASIFIPVILDNDIVEQRKITLISTINHSGD